MVSLTLANLRKTFGAVTAVDNVSLEIARGEFFFLLGPSGCGKTTLLRMIAGFCDPDAGDIRFDDRTVTRLPPHRRNTGMVFQNYALWPHMTVAENVGYGLALRRIAREERRRRIAEALDLVQLGAYGDRKPNALSGGQQQRVALARALVIEPDVLLLDEPLSNLDAKLRIEMRHELRRIHQRAGITAVYVTHDQKEALSMAHRIAVMRNGRVEQAATPRDLYLNPAGRFVAEFIGQANVIAGHAVPGGGDASFLETPFGRLRARGRREGPSVCCLRPEALRLGGASDANRLVGVVADVTYLGDQEQVVLRLQSGDGRGQDIQIMLHHPRGATVSSGERVTVTFDPEDAVLLPPDDVETGARKGAA